MEILCHAEVTKPYPPEWQLVQQLLLTGMNSDEARASFPSLAGWARERVTLDWVAKALSRMHINTFRVDTLPLFAFESWTEEEAEPASGATTFPPLAPARSLADSYQSFLLQGRELAQGESGGSGLFALSSLLNHSCEPALEPFFPNNNAEMALRATRDVVPGEQLTICYVDETASRDVRRALLLENYGFECQCPRCVDGE